MKKGILLSVAAAAALATSAADAALIRNAVSIVIDGSGSISAADFATQVNAYATLFNNASVLPGDGSVVVNVIQFSDTTILEQTAIRIDSAAARATLVASVLGMSQIGSLTAIGQGINLGVSDMDAFLGGIDAAEFDVDFGKLVDVSTDGGNNVPPSPVDATAAAILAGYSAVNCLGIGAGADCTWNDGNGLDFSADTFDELEAVLERKLRVEFDTPVPASIILLAVGLIGVGAVARRNA